MSLRSLKRYFSRELRGSGDNFDWSEFFIKLPSWNQHPCNRGQLAYHTMISDKRLPKRENLDFQISCLYLGLPEVFSSFLIYLSILIKAKTFTDDFVEWFALWCYKSTCHGNCANPHHLLIIISRWFWHDLAIYAELWHPWPAEHHENH